MISDAKVIKQEGFDTFAGVFVPNVTMMFGVIIFMRLSLVVGYIGFWQFTGILAIALTLMCITSASVTMIATNMKVGSGGAYYIISRSLGMDIGGGFGLALIANQLICLCLCVSGFAHSVTMLFPQAPIHIIEIATLSTLTVLSCISSNLALRCQLFIFIILLSSIATIFTGNTSYSGSVEPFFTQPLSFWQAFAIFYPAMTGIEAGMAMSGTLRDPTYSLSKGNIFSLLFAALIYLLIALFLSTTYSTDILQADEMLILHQSRLPVIIYVGIWAATLSTVLGNLMASSKMLQTVAEDGLVPKFLAKTYGVLKEPRLALATIFISGSALVLLTSIDTILPILSMICLLTYSVLNAVAGLCELVQSPSWRPTSSYPWQLCFLGAAFGLVLMFIIDPIWASAAIAILLLTYLWLKSRNHEANFQDFRQTIVMYLSRELVYNLHAEQNHAFHWLPHIAVFTRGVTNPPQKMVALASSITKRSGLLNITSVIPESSTAPEQATQLSRQFLQKWVASESIKCISDVKASESLDAGIDQIIRGYGAGPLYPNTIMVPISNLSDDVEIQGLVNIITSAKEHGKNIILFNDPSKAKDAVFNRAFSARRKIDIWWDPQSGDTFELMLSLILSTRSSLTWRNRDVRVKALVPDVKAKGHLQDHLKNMLRKIRFRAKPDVAIAAASHDESDLQRLSKNADLVYVPLRPITAFQSSEEFFDYLKSFLLTLPLHASAAIVTSYDSVNHREVYL